MPSDVRKLRSIDGSGEPPDMEQRLRHLEQDVAIIKETMVKREEFLGETGSIRSDMHREFGALRSEMHSLLRQQTMWSVGTVIAVAGLIFGIMRFTTGA